jgi:hypothetical protein
VVRVKGRMDEVGVRRERKWVVLLVMLLQKRSSGEVQVDDSGAYMCKQRQPACEETAGT